MTPSETRMNKVAACATCVSGAVHVFIYIFLYGLWARSLGPKIAGKVLLRIPLDD